MHVVTYFDDTWSIDASATDVYDVLADIEKWPEWTSIIKSSSRSGTGNLTADETINFTPNLLVPLPLTTTVRDASRPDLISWGVMITGFDLEHRFEITSNGQTSQVRQVEFAEGVLAPTVLLLKNIFQKLDRTWGDDLADHFNSK